MLGDLVLYLEGSLRMLAVVPIILLQNRPFVSVFR